MRIFPHLFWEQRQSRWRGGSSRDRPLQRRRSSLASFTIILIKVGDVQRSDKKMVVTFSSGLCVICWLVKSHCMWSFLGAGLVWANRSIPDPHRVVPFEASFTISHPTIAPIMRYTTTIIAPYHTAKTPLSLSHTQTQTQAHLIWKHNLNMYQLIHSYS